MTRIPMDVNDEWLDATREALRTDTRATTLPVFTQRKQAAEIVAAVDSV